MAVLRQVRAVAIATVVTTATLLVVLVVPPTPAAACSCEPASDTEQIRRADAVFTGAVARRETVVGSGTAGAGDLELWTFTVSRVYQGRVQRGQRVVSARDGDSCGLALRGRGPFLVFATRLDGDDDPDATPELYQANRCGGTRALEGGAPELGLEAQQPLYVPANWRAVRGAGDERRVRASSAAVVLGLGFGIWWYRRRPRR
jgi:hypothetical protein